MATFLLKTEPHDYAFEDLLTDGRTVWDGVSNPGSCRFMRQVKAGDEAYIYHTGAERRIAGLATILDGPREDPVHPGCTKDGQIKRPVFDVSPVRVSPDSLTLAQIKADRRFEGFELIRQPRLSVMPVPAKFDRLIRKLTGLG